MKKKAERPVLASQNQEKEAERPVLASQDP